MAQIDPARYLVVHDTKSDKDGPRLGILQTNRDQPPRYEPLAIGDWKHPEGPPNDLESACAIAGRSGEFLVAESSYWQGRFGRIFHLAIRGTTAEILHVLKLPLVAKKGPKEDNFEGMACALRADGKVLIILGERGGSKDYSRGVLRWGWYDPLAGTAVWPAAGKGGKSIAAPGAWKNPKAKRDIADLYLDSKGNLWAVASEDAGDSGPFRSLIYRAASVRVDSENPIRLNRTRRAAWIVDGLKVEALAAPTVSGSYLSFASEDESMGGIWRPLYPPVQRN